MEHVGKIQYGKLEMKADEQSYESILVWRHAIPMCSVLIKCHIIARQKVVECSLQIDKQIAAM